MEVGTPIDFTVKGLVQPLLSLWLALGKGGCPSKLGQNIWSGERIQFCFVISPFFLGGRDCATSAFLKILYQLGKFFRVPITGLKEIFISNIPLF